MKSIVQSESPLGPIGVQAALLADSDPTFTPRVTIKKEFDLTGRVAVISGGNRGIGLELAETLCEAGAIVYCLDLPSSPGDDWEAAKKYVGRLGVPTARLEYASINVTDQKSVWSVVEEIANKENRMDICVASAGILQAISCLEYPGEDFQNVINVNLSGCFYTAQAVGRQVARFGLPGSIIMIASMSGSIANMGHIGVAYNASKSAVIQLARSMACELGPKRIRVNTVSPGYILTSMTASFLDEQPHLLAKWSNQNPLGRIGRPDELRGVVAWLASDASTFCTGSDIIVDGGHRAW